MKKIFISTVLATLCFTLVTSCGSLQENTDLSDDLNTDLGLGYIESEKVVVNDREGQRITFDLTKDVVTEFSDYENTDYPLVGKLEDNDIYLYADKDKGAILVKGEFVEYLDLGANGFLTPRGILPELHSGDFNGDSKSEIAVVLYVGSGTGVSFEELYILDDDEAYEEYYKVLALSNSEYSEKLQENLSFEVDESDNVTLTLGSKEYDLNKIEGFTGLGCGDITYFLVEGDDISIASKIGVSTEEVSTPTLYEGTGWIRAKVIPNESGFEFTDIVYEESEDYDPVKDKEQKFFK